MSRLYATAAVLTLFCFSAVVQARILSTPNFVVVIVETCEEGVVGCDQVAYTGVNRSTGKSITLSGSALMHMCADGVTPCQHLGYEFRNGDVTYTVTNDGTLAVSRKGKVFAKEQGKWLAY